MERGLKLTMMLLLLFSFSFSMAMGNRAEEEERGGGRGAAGEGTEGEEIFLLQKAKEVVRTEGGVVRVVKGWKGKGMENPMHIGFITMEPETLFIPQYLDTSLILFLRRGEAKIGWIYKDGLVEKQLRMGDVYRIPAGSAFYMVNTGKGQRLQIICSIDTTESLGTGVFQSFFIGGGSNPSSVLAGFDHKTLSTAFNVSSSQLDEIMTTQASGPIVYIEGGHEPGRWASFMQLKQQERLQKQYDMENKENEEEETSWSWRKLLSSFFQENKSRKSTKGTVGSPDAYNIYDRKPDFRNNYGWSVALDENDYKPLSHSGIGVYLVNLTAGSMMAPHVNPTATEYGVVLRGAGSIQIVNPNGSTAMNRKVEEGDVFWVPRYFPFCQIASRSGPLEFMGFTTSARTNRPQFLVGGSSVLQTMNGPELAMAFGVSEERLRGLINAQSESIILPSTTVSAVAATANKLEKVKLERDDPLIRGIWE